MADPKWDDTEEITEVPSFDETEAIDESREPSSVQSDMTPLEAGLRGAAQGITFDFADELAGALGAAKETAFGDAKLSDLLNTYEQQRDLSREQFSQAEQEYPKTYLAGEIGAGIVPALFTGGASAVASVGKTGLKQAAKQAAKAGATVGAASALGRTKEIEDLGQVAKDVTAGTALGAGFGAATPAIGKGLQKAAKGVKGGIRKVFDSMADLDSKLTDELLSDPTLLKSAKNEGEMAEAFKDVANEGLEEFRNLATKGRKSLSGEKTIRTSEVLDKFNQRFNSLDEIADKAAIKPLMQLRQDVQKKLGAVTSEKDIQEVMDSIANLAYKGQKKDTADVVTKQLRSMREELGSIIKERNPEYADNMFKASQKRKALNELSEKFGLVEGLDKRGLKELGEGDIESIKNIQFKNKDRTISKLKELGTEGKFEMNEVLDDIKDIINIPDEITRSARANKLLKELEKGKTFTTQDLTLAKAMLGFAVNPVVGAAFIGARPAIKSIYKNLDSMPVKIARKAKSILDSASKKSMDTSLFPTAMVAAKSKQDEITKLLSSYEGKPEKKLLAQEVKFNDKTNDELAEDSNKVRQHGYSSFADSLDRASRSESEQEKAAQQSVLNQQPAFRALMRKLEKDKK